MTHASKDERPTVLVVNDDPEELRQTVAVATHIQQM